MTKYTVGQTFSLLNEEEGRSELEIIEVVDTNKTMGFLGQCYRVKETYPNGESYETQKSENALNKIIDTDITP